MNGDATPSPVNPLPVQIAPSQPEQQPPVPLALTELHGWGRAGASRSRGILERTAGAT